MRVKDIWKLLTIGDTKLNEEAQKKLKEIGFSEVPECLKSFGVLLWEVGYGSYEVYIEYPRDNKRRSNKNVYKVLEVIGEGFYGEMFKVENHDVFILHLATSFDGYYNIFVIDREELEEVAFIQISEGYVFCGDGEEISEALSKLVRTIPTYIRIVI